MAIHHCRCGLERRLKRQCSIFVARACPLPAQAGLVVYKQVFAMFSKSYIRGRSRQQTALCVEKPIFTRHPPGVIPSPTSISTHHGGHRRVATACYTQPLVCPLSTDLSHIQPTPPRPQIAWVIDDLFVSQGPQTRHHGTQLNE